MVTCGYKIYICMHKFVNLCKEISKRKSHLYVQISDLVSLITNL